MHRDGRTRRSSWSEERTLTSISSRRTVVLAAAITALGGLTTAVPTVAFPDQYVTRKVASNLSTVEDELLMGSMRSNEL
jgi:hypothetical protein